MTHGTSSCSSRRQLLGCVVLSVLTSGLSENQHRVSIVRPVTIISEDQSSTWMIRVEPHDDNRILILAAVDEDGPVRSSKEQLDEHSPRTRWIRWGSLPAGEYRVVAIVYSATEEVARTSVPLIVLARL